MTDTHDVAPQRPSGEAVGSSSAAASETVMLDVYPKRPAQAVDVHKPAPLGWWPAVVIALVAFIDRVEINLIAGALPAIQDHFGFNDTVAGAIPTAASLAAAILLLPAGRLADRAPRVVTIFIVVLTWAICSVLSGLATSLVMFFAVRVLIGAAGQLYNPPGLEPDRRLLPRAQPREGLRLRAGRLLHGPADRRDPRRRGRRGPRLARGLLRRRGPRRPGRPARADPA